MKRYLALVLALVLTMSLALPVFASAEAMEEITILYPGEETDEMVAFLKGPFAEKVAQELNLKVNFTWLSWSDYWDQKTLKLAAREPIDLYWDGLSNLPGIVNSKEAQPLDELIATYWPESLKEIIPDSQLAGGKIKGEIYGIPSAYAPSSGLYQEVVVRQDLLEAVGMTEIKSAADLRAFAELVQVQFPEFRGPADFAFKAVARDLGDEEQYYTLAYDYMIVFGEETKQAYNFAETEAFKKVAEFNREMYLDGLYSDDLAIKYNERDSRMQTGLYLWVEGSVGKDQEIGGSVRTADPTARLATYALAPEKPRYINATGGEVLCIPYSAKNPTGALKFLAWLWGSQENYMFCLYGVEGQDWELNENGRLVLISNTARGDGYFYEWMFRNANYKVFGDEVTDEYIEMYKHWDDEAIPSAMLGFAFDNTGFEAIETAVQESYKNMLPVMYGYVDWDENYESALAEMKAAGVDEYVAEFNRQLAEFMAQ